MPVYMIFIKSIKSNCVLFAKGNMTEEQVIRTKIATRSSVRQNLMPDDILMSESSADADPMKSLWSLIVTTRNLLRLINS